MTAKKSGWLFCLITVCYIGASIALSIGNFAENIGITGTFILSEAIIAVPGFFFMIFAKDKWKDTLGFHKIKIPTVFLAALYMAFLSPLVVLCNAITLLFADNAAADILSTVSEISFAGMFFFIGILAPVCEECVFRGILYTGFRKTGTPMQAILWTAFLFGLFHMNVNQMVYAMMMGIAFGLLREATGSIWAGIIGHVCMNSYNVLMYYIQTILPTEEIVAAEETLTTDTILMMIGVFLVISLFATPIAAFILWTMAGVENGKEYLKQVFKDRRKIRVWSFPLWFGIIICMGLIAMELLVQILYKNVT